MDIGNKLKHSRTNAGLTQEDVAEKIKVSRQTISNWENNKSYPDIISVINLSDLYSVSLDELLKGDSDMIKYLEKSTNNVKSKERISKIIYILSYLVIWSLCILSFWFGPTNEDVIGYTLMTFYVVLPVTTFIISFLIGLDNLWGHFKWFILLFFGVMYMLACYCTFSLANTLSYHNAHSPEILTMIPGIICSLIGMVIGTIVNVAFIKTKTHP